MGVDVAGRNPDHHRRHAGAVAMDGLGIRAACTSHCLLYRNVLAVGHLQHLMNQSAVADRSRVEQPNLGSFSQNRLAVFESGQIVRRRRLQNHRHIRFGQGAGCAATAASDFFLHRPDADHGVRMRLTPERQHDLAHQADPGAVVQRLPTEDAGHLEFHEFGLRHNRIADPNPHRTHLGAVRGPYVHIHFVDSNHLVALIRRQKMRWRGTDDAGDPATFNQYLHPLTQQHMTPPAAQGDDGQLPFSRHRLDHEPDLVQVAVQNDPGLFGPALVNTQYAAQPVVAEGTGCFKHPADDSPDFPLGPWRPGRLAQFLK